MNAKWKRMVCVSACLPLWFASLAPPSSGSPVLELLLSTAMLGQLPADEPLSRDEVDVLLRQARAAIQQGNLDQADAILQRTERAAVHYPFLHMGPTPASVRREFQKAQRSAPPAKPASAAQPIHRPSAEPGQAGAVVDPFLRRDAALPPRPPLPAGIAAGQAASPDPEDWQAPDRLPAIAPPVTNPFTPSNVSGTIITDGDDGLRLPGEPGGTNPPWTLPATPRPSDLAANQSRASGSTAKQQVLELLSEARQVLDAGDWQSAETLARRAGALAVPESQFLPHEDRPSILAWDILQAKNRAGDLQPARSEASADGPRYSAQPAYVYIDDEAAADDAGQSTSPETSLAEPRLALVPDTLQLPVESAGEPADAGSGTSLPAPAALNPAAIVSRAEAALRAADRESAFELFSQAYLLREGLDPATQQRVEEQLYALSTEGKAETGPSAAASTVQTSPPTAMRLAAVPSGSPASAGQSPASGAAVAAGRGSSLLDATGDGEQLLARQLSAEVGKLQSDARRLREKEPQKALEMLRETRGRVEEAKLSGDLRDQLLRRLDLTIRDTEKYYNDNRHQIELDQQNADVIADVERSREVKLKVQEKIADLVNQYNRLKDEQRFGEAQVVAQQLRDLAPDEQVTQQIWLDAKFVRRTVMNSRLVDAKESSFWEQLNAVEESAVNPVARDGDELMFDQKYWEAFAKGRKRLDNNRRNERELEIERRLRTPVQLKYHEAPLSEVIDGLSTLSGVNIHLDPRGLSQEGIHSDTTVTINLNQEISLKSALNLILEPLHLSYVIKDEVLKITSEQLRDGELVTVTYNVADLVIPIPNFVPNNNIGLQGLINDAYASMSPGSFGGSGPAVMVGQRGGRRGGGAAAGDHVLAQRFNAAPGGMMPSSTVPIGSGPGGMGGGANADFDSLIDLIVSTVSSESWAENGGGEAEIRPFPTNLSLVISQTQAVHEEIADLLAQLRRLVDLQVTIEVRFIRLNDSFFERIGIDFQMNIVDRGLIGATPARAGVDIPGVGVQTGTVGLLPPAFPSEFFPNFTADLEIPFRQGHFAATAPAFGGFDPAQAATFGFAILSDIEAFFLIEAAQADSRTNMLNAPKVTLFNGQQAFVADAVSRPFVVGVIPVVGEFAAAQQPVIVVLNEGTMMTIQAVVSDDRRYVRLTVVPFFTQVGEVREFTFEGSTTSTSSSSSTRDDDDDTRSESQNQGVTRSGVTVQLPAFQFISVVTTVSVPDGGTVLLGGIKRLNEGRTEVGVPLLSKIPYINRLFKNVGIGRETDSLMMMVTPRIIIQEEEEERLGVMVP